MACSFREPIVKGNCVCSTINPRGSFIFSMYLPTSSKSYDLCKFVSFLARDQYGESRAGEGGPITPAQVANKNTEFTSS